MKKPKQQNIGIVASQGHLPLAWSQQEGENQTIPTEVVTCTSDGGRPGSRAKPTSKKSHNHKED